MSDQHLINNKNENFEALFQEGMAGIGKFNDQLVKGVVIAKDNQCVTIDVGLKSEGRIDLLEFRDDEGVIIPVEVGDVVEVFIERYENKDGVIVLSKEKALKEEAWYQLENMCNAGEEVEGFITKRVKGGLMVIVKGVQGFLPGSQLDVRPMKNINSLIETKQKLKILIADRSAHNLVLSRKAIIEQEMKDSGISLSADFKEGDIVEGTVKNITGYGAFIDLGMIDGLLHVTDLSWSRVNHPSEILKINEVIQVKITKIYQDTGRISLGLKQLTEDPWVNIDQRYKVSDKHIPITVINVADYGVFVELEPGVEGLIHVSELSWNKSENNSADYKVGEKLEAVIIDIDPSKRRISLSFKQGTQNPIQKFKENYPVDSTVDVIVKSINEHGVVVEVDNGIEAFIKATDLAWGRVDDDMLNSYKEKIGSKIKAKVLRYDVEREKINLGVKQLDENPFSLLASHFPKHTEVICKVVTINKDYIEVELQPGVKGVIKSYDLSMSKDEQSTDLFKTGQEVRALVLGADYDNMIFHLSIKALEHKDQKQYMDGSGANQDTYASDSLGDMLDQAMQNNNNKPE